MSRKTPKHARNRRRRGTPPAPGGRSPESEGPITAFSEPTGTWLTPDNLDDDAVSASQRNVEREATDKDPVDPGPM